VYSGDNVEILKPIGDLIGDADRYDVLSDAGPTVGTGTDRKFMMVGRGGSNCFIVGALAVLALDAEVIVYLIVSGSSAGISIVGRGNRLLIT